MTSAVTRRAAVIGAVAPLAATAPALAGGSTQEIDALWRQWKAALAASWRASLKVDEAQARLPWWAAPGHKYVNSKGEPIADRQVVGWPAIQDFAPKPEYAGSNVMRLIRPSRYDLRRSFDTESHIFGRARASATFKGRMRKLVRRRRAQREEKEKVGLPAAQAVLEASYGPMNEAEDAIGRLPPSAERLAMLVLLEIRALGTANEPAADTDETESLVRIVLPGLIPLLSGELAADVAAFLAADRTPLEETFLWTGAVTRSQASSA